MSEEQEKPTHSGPSANGTGGPSLADGRAPSGDGVLRIYPPSGGAHAAELADSSRAFAAGNFGGARKLARGVASAVDATEEERAFARQILHRTDIDPVALWVGLGSFALFWLVIYLTLWR